MIPLSITLCHPFLPPTLCLQPAPWSCIKIANRNFRHHLNTIDYFLCSEWVRSMEPIWEWKRKMFSSISLFCTYKLHITNFSINIPKEHISQEEITMIQDIKSTCCRTIHSPPPLRALFNHAVDSIDVLRLIQFRPGVLPHQPLEYPQVVSEEALLNGVWHMVNWIVEARVIGSLLQLEISKENVLKNKISVSCEIDFLTFSSR